MSAKNDSCKALGSCSKVGSATARYSPHVIRRPKLGEIRIVDTTCRDGEQMPGISFTVAEKLEIGMKLEEMGVEQLETFATYNESDKCCAKLLKAQSSSISIMGWNRMVKADIEDSLAHGVDAVSISTDTSDIALEHKLKITKDQQLERLVECVEFAKDHGVYVCFNAGDATRTSIDYLVDFASAGLDAGGDRFRICDTIGVLTPEVSRTLIDSVMSAVKIDIELHAHNDFGLAVANALAACEAASTFDDRRLWISTTVNGLGERAGNVSLEVFVMNLLTHYGVERYKTEHILPLCKYVEKASGLPIPLNYPIVGENMFTHKSGIHVDGVLKDPRLYEAFDPAKLGMQRKIVLGKHSGRASIKHKLDQLGLSVPSNAIELIRAEVGRTGESKKRNITDEEFKVIVHGILGPEALGNSTSKAGSRKVAVIEANILAGT